MALASNTRIGVYEIVAPLGAGGMGEVYRARDTKLDRDVALKILPESFAGDPDRLMRFEREAKTLASLNHPHIAQIHGFEQSSGISALVMELVEGEDLAQRLARGPIPIDDALAMAQQMADALEAAHDAGIIHRDLKPANIKVRADGTVKVLDFGLAKLSAPGATGASDATGAVTSPAQTLHGVILGTAAYMAPEQAKGISVDKRSDIWAFGCVLFEMLSGARAFPGENVTDTLACVITKEPDWGRLPPAMPPDVMRLLRRCLQKNRRARLADIADARLDLADALASSSSSERVARSSRPWRAYAAWALAGFAIATALALAWMRIARPVAETRVVRSAILPPSDLANAPALRLALSPDGRTLAFTAADASGGVVLWTRSLDALTAQALGGTDGAAAPFWSPDGRFIAFRAGAKLKKVGVTGGPVLTLCDTSPTPPGAWNRDDVILFSSSVTSALSKVSAAGGTPAPATALDEQDGEIMHSFPSFLSDGRHFVFSAARRTGPGRLYVGSLDSGERTRLEVPDGAANSFFANGYLLYVSGTTLMAQRLDEQSLTLTGEARPVAERILSLGRGGATGAFSASQTGVLVYQSALESEARLKWFDRSGRELGELSTPASYRNLTISPDGRRVAVEVFESGGVSSVWLIDSTTGVRSRFTFDAAAASQPVWAPDSKTVVYSSRDRTQPSVRPLVDRGNLERKSIGAAGVETLLVDGEGKLPLSVSPDGRFLLYSISMTPTRGHLWVLPLEGERKPVPYIETLVAPTVGQLSADGRFVLYTSNESGREEVYVASFPAPAARWQISNGGGLAPRWSRDGKEVFYVASGTLMAAEVATSADGLEVRAVRSLPVARGQMAGDVGANTASWTLAYDVAPDGRFLVSTGEQRGVTPITLVVNWTAPLAQ